MFNILVVEDNLDLRELFVTTINNAGYRAFGATDGLDALNLMDNTHIDLIVADIMMPKMSGYELTKELRSLGNSIPILMVTAKDDYDSLQKGFSFGADDYMIKPVNVNELLLRIQALLRRARINSEKKIVIGSTIIDYESMTVKYNNDDIVLPLKEFNLLFKLLSFPGKIFTRQQLMDEIWGMDSETDDRTINTHINRLRERFSNNQDFEIVTIRGLGYKAVKKQ
ncbi:MAG TPA: DNA-binding response regulator [Firmicutes bacterium]|nr:DNA-binding response regulator [Bacillota bacterium]HAX00917.1 DNA-binding response regulator [Bacillota bacterium]HCY67200.1 DNA-binding response regulator [Bacillota bacterium]